MNIKRRLLPVFLSLIVHLFLVFFFTFKMPDKNIKLTTIPVVLVYEKEPFLKKKSKEKILLQKKIDKKIIKQPLNSHINTIKKSHDNNLSKNKIYKDFNLSKTRETKIYNPMPSYPYIARKNKWEGNVELKILINKSGQVDKVFIEKSSGYKCLDVAAVKALKKWKFFSYEKRTQLFRELVVPITFKLE